MVPNGLISSTEQKSRLPVRTQRANSTSDCCSRDSSSIQVNLIYANSTTLFVGVGGRKIKMSSNVILHICSYYILNKLVHL